MPTLTVEKRISKETKKMHHIKSLVMSLVRLASEALKRQRQTAAQLELRIDNETKLHLQLLVPFEQLQPEAQRLLKTRQVTGAKTARIIK